MADMPKGYFFHAKAKGGGLATPSLRAITLEFILRNYGGFASSRWSAAKAAARSDRIEKKLSWTRKQVQKFTRDHPMSNSKSVSQYWREMLHASIDGYDLRELSGVRPPLSGSRSDARSSAA